MRVGRGIGSGKGQDRADAASRARRPGPASRIKGFEGGQMPLHRRLPKRGFTNIVSTLDYNEVNLGRIQKPR